MAVGSGRIVELDGLRGLAAILVVIAHYFGEVPGGFRALTAGWLGVSVFFVLSGFLIGSIILENRTAPNFIPVFYLRRACRILPIYAVTVAGVFAIITVVGPGHHWLDAPLPFPAYATFTQNFAMAAQGITGNSWLLPTWTLAVEEQFYLLAPLALVLLPRRHLPTILLSGIAAAVLFRWITFDPQGSWLVRLVLLPSRMDLLLAGVLTAVFARAPWLDRPRVDHVLRSAPLGAAFALLVILLCDPQRQTAWFAVAGPTVVAAGTACFILAIVRGAPEGKRMRSRTLRFFGTISYGLYLLHQPVAGLLHGLMLDGRPDISTPAQLAVTVAALGLSVLLAWLSWRLLEAPVQAWGRRWPYRPGVTGTEVRV